MKIKQVCEATGLTDRAVRYYIEEGLIAPRYTENYLGRKAFDFSEEDAAQLSAIAKLRKFGFAVEEIRQVQADAKSSPAVLAQVRARKQQTIADEQETLNLLDRLGRITYYTVPQLAEALGDAARKAQLPPESLPVSGWDVREFLWKALLIGGIALAPVGFLAYWLAWCCTYYRYPTFGLANLACILLTLVPTGALAYAWLKPGRPLNDKARRILIGVCAAYLFVSWQCAQNIVGPSETTDIHHYGAWDYYIAAEDPRIRQLFPDQVKNGLTGRLGWNDASYYYRCELMTPEWVKAHPGDDDIPLGDFDIFAEWGLPEEEFAAEVGRVTALFGTFASVYQCEQGDYTCLFGKTTSPQYIYWTESPFQPLRSGNYHYSFFAYDESTCRVRYGYGFETNGGDRLPYYLSLDW